MRENRMSGGVGGVTGNPRHLDPIVRPGFQPEKCPSVANAWSPRGVRRLRHLILAKCLLVFT
jgi:hypothetical protein